ncbi:MAG: mechanosensitive ion channel family protein [Novosphingobium sp.]|nr:mechanosensitive ion channel family protein [Novosphingobium sp.]
MAIGMIQSLPSLAIALVILIVTWILARSAVRIAARITRRAELRDDLKQLVETLTRLTIWIVGIVIALTVAIPSFTPAGAFAGLGVGALAIGFAFQDIFENFLAGVLIMLRDKMRIGDVVECEGIMGKVEHTSLRETHIRHLSNELTVVPNSLLFKNPVKILTDDVMRRNELVVGVSYDTDLDHALKVIRDTLGATPEISKDRPIDVFAQEFNASSVDFLVRFWCDSRPRDLRETKSIVIMAIKRALDEAKIEIPFPYVTHTFKQSVPVEKVRDEHEAA